MLEYLAKFKNLPKAMQQLVTSHKATAIINDLKKKYRIDLNSVVIKIMVKDIQWQALPDFLVAECGLDMNKAKELQAEMARGLLSGAHFYLGIKNIQDNTIHKSSMHAFEEVERKEIVTLDKKINDLGINRQEFTTLDERVANILPTIMRTVGVKNDVSGESVRLRNIIRTCLKGIRDLLDTRETLTKPKEAGGLGIDRQKADEIIKILKEDGQQPNTPKLAVPAKKSFSSFDKLEQLRDVEYHFNDTGGDYDKKDLFKPSLQPHKFSADELAHEIAPPPPAIIKNHDLMPVSGEKITISKTNHSVRAETKSVKDAPELATSSNNSVEGSLSETIAFKRQAQSWHDDKVQMNDILKPSAKSQGPIEELAWMDLIKFRRLGDNAETAVKKIENKIRLLEQEGFTKRQQGVNAWRRSPLYKIYIDLGQRSLLNGQSIENFLSATEEDGDSLTMEEFNAIVELNKCLRL